MLSYVLIFQRMPLLAPDEPLRSPRRVAESGEGRSASTFATSSVHLTAQRSRSSRRCTPGTRGLNAWDLHREGDRGEPGRVTTVDGGWRPDVGPESCAKGYAYRPTLRSALAGVVSRRLPDCGVKFAERGGQRATDVTTCVPSALGAEVRHLRPRSDEEGGCRGSGPHEVCWYTSSGADSLRNLCLDECPRSSAIPGGRQAAGDVGAAVRVRAEAGGGSIARLGSGLALAAARL
jgi:hypothetical protein